MAASSSLGRSSALTTGAAADSLRFLRALLELRHARLGLRLRLLEPRHLALQAAHFGLGPAQLGERAPVAGGGQAVHLGEQLRLLLLHPQELRPLLAQARLAQRRLAALLGQLALEGVALALGPLRPPLRQLQLAPRRLDLLARRLLVEALLLLVARGRRLQRAQPLVDGALGRAARQRRLEQRRPGDPRQVLQRIAGDHGVEHVLEHRPQLLLGDRAALEQRRAQRLAHRALQRRARVGGGEIFVGEHPRHLLRRQRLEAVAGSGQLELGAELEQALVGEAELEKAAQPIRLQRGERERRARERQLGGEVRGRVRSRARRRGAGARERSRGLCSGDLRGTGFDAGPGPSAAARRSASAFFFRCFSPIARASSGRVGSAVNRQSRAAPLGRSGRRSRGSRGTICTDRCMLSALLHPFPPPRAMA